MKAFLRCAFGLCLFFAIPIAHCESFLDRDFLVETSGVYSTIVLDSGKILIGGVLTSVNGYPRPSHLARLNSDGSLDLSFNPPLTTAGSVDHLQLQVDGKIMKITDTGFIERLLPDGTLDTGFNCTAPGVVAVYTMPDGKIMIGGNFTIIQGKPRQYFARLNNNGSLDDTYARDVPGTVTAILGQADGKVIIGGIFDDIGGTARHGLARLDVSGNLDITFNLGGQALPPGMAPRVIKRQADGSLRIMSATALFRVTSSGVADASFPASPIIGGNLRTLAEFNGGFLLGGNYINNKDLSVVRMSAAGLIDTNFGVSFSPMFSYVTDFAIQPDGKVLLAGTFTAVDGELRFGIARLNTVTVPSGSLTIRVAPAITVSGAVGTKYRVEYSTKVRDAIWSALTDVVLTEPQVLFIDTDDTGENRFYRAVPVP